MITFKDAVENSIRFFKDVSVTAPQGLRVEEVKLSDDDEHWLITLGFQGEELVVEADSGSLFGGRTQAQAHPRHEREYKLFRVRRDDGNVEEMTIRTLTTA